MPRIWWGQVQGNQSLVGGLMKGDIDLIGGPNFERLYHKLKVLLLGPLQLFFQINFKIYKLGNVN